MLVFNFFVFVFGLIVGSFLNCVIYRMEAKCRGAVFAPVAGEAGEAGEETSPLPLQSPLRGRSFCPHCKHILSWQDLIPVFSFLILKGKCRYCGKKISIQYPLVELSTGLLFLIIFNFFTPPPNFGGGASFSIFNQFSIFNFQNLLTTFYLLLITCFLIIIFVYDLKHYIISDKIIYSAIIIALIFNFFTPPPKFGGGASFSIFKYSILSALGASLFFLLIVLVSRGKWMGLGDVKLAFFMGLFLGFPKILVALFFAFLIGAIIGIGLVAAKKKSLKSEVPFGPFLITGTFIALFWGQEIIQWYLNLFNF